jgi:uncharacterized membrane protein (DUF485 family)
MQITAAIEKNKTYPHIMYEEDNHQSADLSSLFSTINYLTRYLYLCNTLVSSSRNLFNFQTGGDEMKKVIIIALSVVALGIVIATVFSLLSECSHMPGYF